MPTILEGLLFTVTGPSLFGCCAQRNSSLVTNPRMQQIYRIRNFVEILTGSPYTWLSESPTLPRSWRPCLYFKPMTVHLKTKFLCWLFYYSDYQSRIKLIIGNRHSGLCDLQGISCRRLPVTVWAVHMPRLENSLLVSETGQVALVLSRWRARPINSHYYQGTRDIFWG